VAFRSLRVRETQLNTAHNRQGMQGISKFCTKTFIIYVWQSSKTINSLLSEEPTHKMSIHNRKI